jgi:hypothetical protein
MIPFEAPASDVKMNGGAPYISVHMATTQNPNPTRGPPEVERKQ